MIWVDWLVDVVISCSVTIGLYNFLCNAPFETKLWLYNACILPVFPYGSEVWSVTSTIVKKIDALDNWCLRRILHIHWTDFISDVMVRSHMGQPLLSDTIRRQHLSFFGHFCHANTSQDHSQAFQACIRASAKHWQHWTGRPRQPLLRTICAHSVSAWQWQGGLLCIDWCGIDSWRRLFLPDMLHRE